MTEPETLESAIRDARWYHRLAGDYLDRAERLLSGPRADDAVQVPARPAERPWIACAERLPPRGTPVETKVDDEHGVRNEQLLMLHDSPGSKLWFFPDGRMCVYYTPTHWRE